MKHVGCCLVLVALFGCGGAPPPEDLPLPPKTAPAPQDAAAVEAGVASVGSLSLAGALAHLDDVHPRLAAYRAEVRAAEARRDEAGAFPNPSLELRAENVPWHRGNTLDQGNYVAGLTFAIPWAGRLGAGEEAGAREVDLRLYELAAERLELQGEVRSAYATALSLERAADLQAQVLESATRAEALLADRVRVGDAIPAELARAQLAATQARLERERLAGLRREALSALALSLGDPGLRIAALADELEIALALPELDELHQRLARNPSLRAAEAEVALAAARVEVARAERVPDVSLDLFYRRLEQTDQHAFDVGLTIPLPVFDPGRVRSAQAERDAAAARAHHSRNALLHEMRALHGRLGLLLSRAAVFREEVLPRADTVLASGEARFEAGDASLAELLPLRREWANVQLGYIDALRDVMLTWSELQALASDTP